MPKNGFPEIFASAFLPKSSGHTEPLVVDETTGVLQIPKGVIPTGFFLQAEVEGPGVLSVVVARKDVGKEKGGYHMDEIEQLGRSTWRITHPFEVKDDPESGVKYTPWHTRRSNRLDFFIMRPGGELFLLQAGVVVRGIPGQETYHLLTEQLWHGNIVWDQERPAYVGVPSGYEWGSFASRNGIFRFPSFRRAIGRVAIAHRVVPREEEKPPLGTPPNGCARIDWFIPFAGHRGQGIGILATGTLVYVIGDDMEVRPDPDGIVRIPRGTVVGFSGFKELKKKDGLTYLTGVRLA